MNFAFYNLVDLLVQYHPGKGGNPPNCVLQSVLFNLFIFSCTDYILYVQ